MEKLKVFILNKKVIISVIALLLLSLISFIVISNITTSKGKITVDTKVEEKLVSSEEQKVQEYILVDIKGEVQTPGVYKLPVNSRVIDQTTPNMIQRISEIFERKPLISKEI